MLSSNSEVTGCAECGCSPCERWTPTEYLSAPLAGLGWAGVTAAGRAMSTLECGVFDDQMIARIFLVNWIRAQRLT